MHFCKDFVEKSVGANCVHRHLNCRQDWPKDTHALGPDKLCHLDERGDGNGCTIRLSGSRKSQQGRPRDGCCRTVSFKTLYSSPTLLKY